MWQNVGIWKHRAASLKAPRGLSEAAIAVIHTITGSASQPPLVFSLLSNMHNCMATVASILPLDLNSVLVPHIIVGSNL